ncbi:hypothetical protein RI367_003134 [Sorochytrium milnesiophthora]
MLATLLALLACAAAIAVADNQVPARSKHNVVLLNKELYFINGLDDSLNVLGNTLSVAVGSGASFSQATAPYRLRSSDPGNAFSASQCHPYNANQIRCIGGTNQPQAVPGSMVDLVFDRVANKWSSAPSLSTQTAPSSRYDHRMAYNNQTYFLYGGSTSAPPASELGPSTPADTSMWALDLQANAWQEIKSAGAAPPPGLSQFTLTSLRSATNLLIAIGGIDQTGAMNPMSKISVFDTQALTWTSYTAGGDVPSDRRGHAACSVGEFTYVYGGADPAGAALYSDLRALVYKKDAADPSTMFTWKKIFVPTATQSGASSNWVIPSGRAFHQLTCLEGINMIMASYGTTSTQVLATLPDGTVTFDANKGKTQDFSVYMYDITKMAWTGQLQGSSNPGDERVPTVTSAAATTTNNGKGISLAVIIAIAVASVIVFMFIVCALCYIQARSRRRRRDRARIPSFVPLSGADPRKSGPPAMSGGQTRLLATSMPMRDSAAALDTSEDDFITPINGYGQHDSHILAPRPMAPLAPGTFGPPMLGVGFTGPSPPPPNGGNLNILYMGPAQPRAPVVTSRPVIPIVQVPNVRPPSPLRSPILATVGQPIEQDLSSSSIPSSPSALGTSVQSNGHAQRPVSLDLDHSMEAAHSHTSHAVVPTVPHTVHPAAALMTDTAMATAPITATSLTIPTLPPLSAPVAAAPGASNTLSTQSSSYLTHRTQNTFDDGVQFASVRRHSVEHINPSPQGVVITDERASVRSFGTGIFFADGDESDAEEHDLADH